MHVQTIALSIFLSENFQMWKKNFKCYISYNFTMFWYHY